jgi:flagellar motor protein MotB
MTTSTKLAILLFAVCTLIAGAWFAIKPFFKEKLETAEREKREKFEREITDAKVKSTLTVAGDGYLGYFFATSKQTVKEAARQGLGIRWVDDGAAIADRVAKLKSGQYDIIAIPAAEYLLHGRAAGFPGVIVAGIASSNGGDGIVALKSKLPDGDVAGLNDSSLQWVYTGESPSEFLVDITVKDLDLFELRAADENAKGGRGGWRKPVSSSADVYTRAMNGQGDVFVMWEPDLSRSLQKNPNLTYVWGSDKFAGYIVDYFVVNKKTLATREKDVLAYFKAYFRSLDHYRRNSAELTTDMARWADLDRETVEAIVKGQKIDWLDLHDNFQQQFGIAMEGSQLKPQEGVIDTILSCSDVLIETGRIAANDISDPYRLVNSSVLESLKNTAPRELGQGEGGGIFFGPLDTEAWGKLKEVAKLQVRPIRFRNETEFEVGGAEEADKLAKLLAVNYPNYRVIIRGHTGGEDTPENRELSALRAEVVMKRLVLVHGFDEDRLLVQGVGSTQPPALRPGENPRSRGYRARVPRVEAILVERGGL